MGGRAPRNQASASVAASALRMAMEWPVVRRALGFAAVVGAILIAINHGGALLEGDVDSGHMIKMGLTLLVPYVVSTLSSVMAMRESNS